MLSDESSEDNNGSPRACDKLVSKALLSMSVEERNKVREEIHGVRNLARSETPELVRNSLVKLAEELNNDAIIPPEQKRAYLRSRSFTNPPSYISSDAFKLRFLRLEFFDISRAARQIMKFVEVLLEMFGEFALQRPIRLSDFPKREQQYIRKGHLQYLPFRDRSGRRILVNFLNNVYETFPPVLKVNESN